MHLLTLSDLNLNQCVLRFLRIGQGYYRVHQGRQELTSTLHPKVPNNNVQTGSVTQQRPDVGGDRYEAGWGWDKSIQRRVAMPLIFSFVRLQCD